MASSAKGLPAGAQSFRRRWAFRLASVLLVPAVLAAAAELLLRLAGYGYPTGFFKPQNIGNEPCLVENDKFGLRFFPPELARSPSPVVMKARKEPGACRVFIFGESAALGDPRPAYGAGRYLEALLKERFPQGRFEVLCVAMTAINSHAIRVIARECARYEGDLWILYLGNNEMIGPFGVTGVIGAVAPSVTFVRLNLALQKTRVGQLLLAAARKLRKKEGASWGGMKMWVSNRVAPDDIRKEMIYQNFHRNLEEMIRTEQGAGSGLVLSTMAVNLRDCPPLATHARANFSSSEQAVFSQLEREAAVALAESNLVRCAAALSNAARLDPHRADLEFRLAECVLGIGDTNGARQRFSQARDLDALPFRADSRLNGAMEHLARKYAGSQLAFFDAQAVVAAHSPGGIAGQDVFYEHVHLNFDGNYQLALAWAARAEQLLGTNLTGAPVGPWASQQTCERRLGLTDWNRAGVLDDVLFRLTQPPLKTQANNAQRAEAFRARLKELRRGMTPPAAAQARELYQEALARAPRDHRLHENFAEFLEATGDPVQAAAEWQQVTALLPHHHLGFFQAGRLLARTGRMDPAQTNLLQAVRLRPDLSEGWLELGMLALARKQPERALESCESARRLLPQDARVYYIMGSALSKLDRRAEAIQRFAQATQLKPDYWEALYALGEELAFDGKVAEARTRFEQVLKLKPDHAMTRLNLGVALFKLGQREEALRQFEEALRLDPSNQLARQYLQQLSGRR